MTPRASRVRAFFASPWLHASWAVASALVLYAAWRIDPYVFGAATFAAAGVSGLVAVGAAAANWRRLPWALVAAVPTALAFARLSTVKWA